MWGPSSLIRQKLYYLWWTQCRIRELMWNHLFGPAPSKEEQDEVVAWWKRECTDVGGSG